MHNENQLLEKMPKLKSKKFCKRFFNLKNGFQKIFNRQQLNEKTESIVTPRIQEVNDGAGTSRDILNENLYVSAEDENFETNNSISEENTPSILNSDKSELYSDFDPENTICSSDIDTVDLPKSNKGVHNIKEGDNVLIMTSIENLIKIFKNFGALCPRCGSSSIEYKPTYQDGIRFFLTLVCNECEKCAGGWSLPKSANFAMVLHTLTNGIKFKKLEKFFLGMLNFQEFRIKYKIQIL